MFFLYCFYFKKNKNFIFILVLFSLITFICIIKLRKSAMNEESDTADEPGSIAALTSLV